MTKTKKILLAIFIPLAVLLVAAYVTLYFVFPEETQNYTFQVWEYLNQPLPLVGCSALAIGVILWRVIASSSFGKKRFNQLKNEYKTLKIEYEETLAKIEEWKKQIESGIEITTSTLEAVSVKLKESCMANPNKKIKAIGESINVKEREEATHNETTAE